MMFASVLVFSVIAFGVSFLIGKSTDLDRSKIAAYVTLIAWGSLFYGMSLAKMAR